MSWRNTPIVPWRKERFAQDEFARPENTTWLGKFLAGAFLLGGIVGVLLLARTARDIQRNDDIALAAWTNEFVISERRCTMKATAALRNDGDAILQVTRIQLTSYSGARLDTEHPALADGMALAVEGTGLAEFEVDLGASCPAPSWFDTGFIEIEWQRADETERVRTRLLDTN